MKKNIILLFLVWMHTFVFSAEENLKQQFLAMTIKEACNTYGNSSLTLNRHDALDTDNGEKILGKDDNTQLYIALYQTLNTIASDFRTQQFITYGSCPLTKEDVSNLTVQQFVTIPFAYNNNFLSQKQLDIFAHLPNALHEKIRKNYSADSLGWQGRGDHRIKITYRNKITPFLIAKETLLHSGIIPSLSVIIGSLLHTYFVTKPIWDNIIGTADPAVLARNAEWEITNALIDNLQKNGIAGSQNLHKILLNNPLKYTHSDYLDFFEPLFPVSFVLNCLIGYELYCITKENNKTIIYQYSPIKEAFLAFITSAPFSLILSSIISIISYGLIPTEEIDTMAKYLNYARITIITLLLTWILYDSISSTIKKLSQWQPKSIDFEKDKTVKECIEKYLNDPSIEIRDF